MKRTAALPIILVLTLSLCACKSTAARWQEQYDLGVRYLEEGNYEKAVLAFEAAIEIDPKRAETYEKLADAYLALGDTDMARKVLDNGVSATGDEGLRAYADKLREAEPPPDPTSVRPEEPAPNATEAPTPVPESTQMPVKPPAPDKFGWSAAYRDFLVNEEFLTSSFDYGDDTPSHPWGSDVEQSAALYDMDVDGVPELFVYNGYESRYDGMYYVYTFSKKQIVYIGRIMSLSYKPGSQFPGIWSYWTAWGTDPDYYSYAWKDGDQLHVETVYSQEFGSTYQKRETDNAELYNEFISTDYSKLSYLRMTPVGEIQSMGWDSFVSTILG